MAKAAGVTPSAVYQWLGHGSKPINSIGDIEAAMRLAAATGFCALWIAKGKGPKHPVAPAPSHAGQVAYIAAESDDLTQRYAKNSKMAPVIDWASLGVELLKTNKELIRKEFISTPSDANELCKWVTMETDIQRFRIKKGDKIAVDPSFETHSIEDGTLCLFISIKRVYFIGEFRSLTNLQFEAVCSDGSVVDSIRHGVQVAAVVRGTWR